MAVAVSTTSLSLSRSLPLDLSMYVSHLLSSHFSTAILSISGKLCMHSQNALQRLLLSALCLPYIYIYIYTSLLPYLFSHLSMLVLYALGFLYSASWLLATLGSPPLRFLALVHFLLLFYYYRYKYCYSATTITATAIYCCWCFASALLLLLPTGLSHVA